MTNDYKLTPHEEKYDVDGERLYAYGASNLGDNTALGYTCCQLLNLLTARLGQLMCIYMKRLDKGRFACPWQRAEGDTLKMTMSELSLFLEGSELVFF